VDLHRGPILGRAVFRRLVVDRGEEGQGVPDFDAFGPAGDAGNVAADAGGQGAALTRARAVYETRPAPAPAVGGAPNPFD
jgi:hypothetical protein